MRRIDSHTHFDAIDDPRVVALMEKHGVSTVSWAYMRHRPKTLSAFTVYFEDQHRTCAAGQGQGVRVHRLVGIHPRSIPESYVTVEDIRADDIQAVFEDAVKATDVIGVGEIGLERATDVEKAVFEIQLDYAEQRGLPICIHTPRKDKAAVSRKIFAILDRLNSCPGRLVVDHVISEDMLENVLGRGYYAGITVSRSKSTVEDAVRMIRQHRHDAHRIMINSDAMTAGPEEYQMFLDVWEYLDEETMAVAGETAKSFFGL